MNLGAKINREHSSKTMLIQCSTPDAKVQVPKMIQWQDVKLPIEWLLEQESPLAKPIFDEPDFTHIQQYLDGIVKISFQNNQPLRINKGRHSFAGSESISKRDQDLNDFLQKNFEKSANLKLKGVSSDKSQISYIYYSTKPEASSPYSRIANEEEDDSKSVCPSDLDFPPIENPTFQDQLRVLKVLKLIWFPCIMNLCLLKIENKRKYFQISFTQFEKNHVKIKWLEKMNQLRNHILFFDSLENHYVSKDEVSKQHLNFIKRSNFVKEDKIIVRSSHPPLEIVLITCQNNQNQKTEVNASPFKIANAQTPIISIIEQNNFTNESLHVIGQQLDRIEKKNLLKKLFLSKTLFLLKTLFLKNLFRLKMRNL